MVMNDLPWDSPGNASTDSLGMGLPVDLHNNVAHKYISRGYGWENKLSTHGDAATWLPLAKYNKYVYGNGTTSVLLLRGSAKEAHSDTRPAHEKNEPGEDESRLATIVR
jgi:hypothetical protein